MRTTVVPPRRCRRAYARILRQADRLDALASGSDATLAARVDSISAWSVAQQLDHVASANRAMASAIARLLDSSAGDSRRGPTAVGRIVMLTGWIPRGVGQAPEYTTPGAVSSEAVRENLRASRAAIDGLAASLCEVATASGRVDHFAFGGLTASQWLRVMGIHTHHHLKIIRDIQRGLR